MNTFLELLDRFKTWVAYITAPHAGVERELAWRGHVLNTLIVGLMVLSGIFFILDMVYWILGLDNGSVIVAFALLVILGCLFWLSQHKSVPAAIILFSLVNVAVSFLLSFGWGVKDIATNAFYVMAIVQTSLLLRGKPFVLVLGILLLGYLGIGWAELDGWFTAPFFTELRANHFSVAILLFFLTFLGYTTSHLVDRVLTAQVAEAARRQELESRTRIATEVQLSMLPTGSPFHPDFDIAGQSIPARDVGGDFYSYHRFPDDELAIIVGDVTGKGIPAALLMAVTTGMMDSLTPGATEPRGLLAAATTRLHRHSQRSGLNAACLVTFLNKARLRVANAGCIAPAIRRINGRVEWLDINGLPMGVMVGGPVEYNQTETILIPGDLIIFATDGVVEAQNSAQQMLGFDSLEAIISSGPAHSAQAMALHILDKVESHRGSAEQNDDVTVVVVRVKGDLPLAI